MCMHEQTVRHHRDQTARHLYLDAQDNDGWTALHHTSVHGNMDIAKLLLDAGIDTHITDTRGRTAADVARENGHVAFAQFVERSS
jgi:ankyrin repeat protein